MALSSSTLFHFTNSLDVLYKILEEGFWPRYCKETGWRIIGRPPFMTPMVSFCDIPLSQIHNHIDYYGNYGIGVTKKWAMENGITPVCYVSRLEYETFKALMEEKVSRIVYIQKFSQLMTRIKPYVGWNWVKRESRDIISNYVYYDEREWRYVPKGASIRSCKNLGNEEEAREILLKESKVFKSQSIKPAPDDICYIIIKDESERLNAIREIDKLLGRVYTPEQLSLLKSRILACSQIRRDF